ncbi:PrpF protein-domain-containing protein [Aspergillus caelatus]|uniref:PrpF protein-domain-containing protein n=1 Tax=Aspergillus caelatus TaxID=61420 RepID=A0A5N7A0S5_9EURO|nr:PrpF protein-domain-containing protein [Aspergillus caelatus]KAE8363457.1 PrpF protein-domain-containing protein [Aspergillus caelatus]
MPDDWVETGLVAEAAKQRQMEQLNFRQAKLDFDGVDPDLGMHLLSLHWNRQHHSFLITYRPAFMRDMACNGPYFSKLLLNAIYFGAAKFSPRLEVRKDPKDVRTAGWRYRERVRELLGGALDRSDITTIQALLVMTNSLFALGDERSAAWLYSGLAFRMLIDLGMHVDLTSTRRFSDEDLEIRRRVFWGAFVVDKIQSLYQGRPVSLKETDALVPIKFLDTYEELEHWQPFAYSTSAPDYPGMPAYSISTFTYLCKLSLTMSDILSCIYTERSSNQSPAELASMLDELQLRLDQWQVGLPEHLRFDPGKAHSVAFPPPHVSSLHAMHNSLVILLHRPFVADGHLYSTSPSISVDSFKKCASAATNISNLLRAYHRAFSIRRAPYLISYATYVAATVLTRIAARRRNDSTAHANLATCLAVFNENQETNSAVKKAANIVQGLMKKLGVIIDNVSLEALEIDPPIRCSERDLQPSHGATEGDAGVQASSGNEIQNSLAIGNVTGLSNNKSLDHPTTSSPGSDWVDIDGIIQSFLQENSSRGARLVEYETNGTPTQLPRTPWMPLHQGDIPASVMMDNARTVGNQASLRSDIDVPNGAHRTETAGGTYQWQHGWRPTNWEPTSLEDPLFGLNGSPSIRHGSPDDPLPAPNIADMATELVTKTRHLRRHALPCVLMRAGTSKGIFLHQKDMPTKQVDWAPHLISALGSRGNDPRQIDGVGGGTSTTSKVAVVQRSQRPDADVDWTFVQVAVGKESVDFTGTCGNMTAGVAPFAIQEGLVTPEPDQSKMDVRIYNTNTDRIVIETVAVDGSGDYEEDGNFIIPGVKTPGSEVKCTFVNPVGSMTGKLFPSDDQQQQTLRVQPGSLMPSLEPFDVRVTLIDSANPFVLIDTTSISPTLLGTYPSDSDRNDLVETIRRAGAVAMGLATDAEAASRTRGTPKAALVYPPTFTQVGGGKDSRPDIRVQAYSMGLPHPSLQLTGAVTIAVALSYPGTVAAGLSAMGAIMHGALPPTPEQSPPPDDRKNENLELGKDILIEHSQGTMKVGVVMDDAGEVASCAVSRTARRLFEGKVRYYVQEI